VPCEVIKGVVHINKEHLCFHDEILSGGGKYMRMKYIFLDIDGVLNSQQIMKEEVEAKKKKQLGEVRYELSLDNPHPEHIKWLNKITDATGAELVISSTWRHDCTDPIIWMRFFALLGITGHIAGFTPVRHTFRGTEILEWILEHIDGHWKNKPDEEKLKIDSICILDDDSDMLFLTPFLVLTRKEGLREKEALEAIEVLNKKAIINISTGLTVPTFEDDLTTAKTMLNSSTN
jgi:hypothetical protein